MPPEGGEVQVYAGFVRAAGDSDLDCIRRYLIADVYARFRRREGDAVSFPLGIADLDEALEAEAEQTGLQPGALVDQRADQLRELFERLGISCDWSATVVSSSPRYAHALQRRFVQLFEAGLIDRTEAVDGALQGRWVLRTARHAAACQEGLSGLAWANDALESQREALRMVEGVEVEVAILGHEALTVFTPHPDAISQAAFVGVPNDHPSIPAWGPERGTGGLLSGIQAIVPGVDSPLPVLARDAEESPFGSSAWLGIPSEDESDGALAAGLPPSGGLALKVARSQSKPRPSRRYLVSDLPVSRRGSRGAPVPVLECPQCSWVPLPLAEEPAVAASEDEVRCPSCGGPARLESDVISGDFADMWMWAPFDEDTAAGHRSRLLLWSRDDPSGLLRQRIAGRLTSCLNGGPPEDAEPFEAAGLIGSFADAREDDPAGVHSVEDLDALLASAGPDVVRFALLSTAAPRSPTRWAGHSIRHAERFTEALLDYAEPRLREGGAAAGSAIDRSSRPRRRLAAWCAIAHAKISASYESLAMHRATFEATLLLRSIQEFERRRLDAGDLSREDEEAIQIALLALLADLSPCLPALAGKLAAASPAA
jgi:leucyl-tRNA synthetase